MKIRLFSLSSVCQITVRIEIPNRHPTAKLKIFLRKYGHLHHQQCCANSRKIFLVVLIVGTRQRTTWAKARSRIPQAVSLGSCVLFSFGVYDDRAQLEVRAWCEFGNPVGFWVRSSGQQVCRLSSAPGARHIPVSSGGGLRAREGLL